MKKDVHPTYYSEAEVKCSCGNTFNVGSTKENIEVEVCSDCHPFFTGQEKVMDTAGRVEKFKARQKKATPSKNKVNKKEEKKKESKDSKDDNKKEEVKDKSQEESSN